MKITVKQEGRFEVSKEFRRISANNFEIVAIHVLLPNKQ